MICMNSFYLEICGWRTSMGKITCCNYLYAKPIWEKIQRSNKNANKKKKIQIGIKDSVM